VLALFTNAGITGWPGFPVEVIAKDGTSCTDFHLLAIHGRCGPLDLTWSAIELCQFPGGWFPYFRGHFFDPSSWDGSDIFMHRRDTRGNVPSMRMLSARAANLLSKQRVKDISLEPLERVLRSTDNYEIGLSHLLPGDFTERVRTAYSTAGLPAPRREWLPR